MPDDVRLEPGDCREVIKRLADDSIDSCVTDPPYSLVSIQKRFGKPGQTPVKIKIIPGQSGSPYERGARGFMGKQWDTGEVAHDPAFWTDIYRVLKPGAHVLAFGGTRTYHRLACAIEDAGFEIRDMVAWLYGTGFPKSHDISKAIDKAAGAEREIIRERYTVKRIKPGATVVAEGEWGKQEIPYTAVDSAPATDDAQKWDGWGTALKPALEPIVLARKPLSEKSIAANVLRWGTGALNIDACRIEGDNPSIDRRESARRTGNAPGRPGEYGDTLTNRISPERYMSEHPGEQLGRWPANVVHDGSAEVETAFPDTQSGELLPHHRKSGGGLAGTDTFAIRDRTGESGTFGGDAGSAARFFFSAKADKDDRWGSRHPTVKPIELIRFLMRLVTPPNGLVIDPFAGSGTAGVAAMAEGFGTILIERDEEYLADIRARLAHYRGDGAHSLQAKNRAREAKPDPDGLFAETPAC